ncbi:MAG: hypothetical protein ACLQU2_18445 [Candidatus Binataceae bacterium]
MNSVIITDYGVALGKTGDRLVVRGPRPKLELIEGGPQLFLPLGDNHKRPVLSVVTSNGPKTPPPPLRRQRSAGGAEARAIGKREREAVIEAAREMREMVEQGRFPEPTPVRARCVACEYRNFCADIW